MLSQLLNQMDEYLSNKPFKRRWWFRRWVVHMTIQPPLSRDYPLWKRSKDELRLLRLFNLSPEELGRKIERYWKKPFWRRWFASFGMNKKIDVWNYYQRCLAYRAVRPDKLEQRSLIVTSENRLPLNELGLVLHQFNVKFETYLEKRCRNPKWIEKHFLEEIKAYKQKLKKTFLTKLNKSLNQIKTGGDPLALKQQAEQEYRQVEVFMLRYYHQWLNDFFSRPQPTPVPEIGTDVPQEKNRVNPERAIMISNYSQAVSSSFQSRLPREVNPQHEIPSLHGAKEWIQTQRERLKLLLEEGSLQKVEELLKTSLNEIKAITESYLDSYEATLSAIRDQPEIYGVFLGYLDDLQCRLKPLLQGGILLFHPDHVMNLTHSQTMKELITRYSQTYLEQSRCYLGRFKNYHLRIEGFYQHSQQELQRKQSRRDRSDLARRIRELDQSVKDLEQSFKEFCEKLNEFEARRSEEKEAMEAQLKESENKRMQDKADSDAKLGKYKAESDAKLAQYKAESDAQINELRNLIDSLQQASTSDTHTQKSNNTRLFKH